MALHIVTGGAGFIGSHIVRALLARNDRVRVLDNFSTGKESNLVGYETSVDVREVDLAASDDLQHHFEGADTVFHQAAIPSVPRSLAEPITCHEANITATLKVLVACGQARVRRVVYASSSAVYGNSPDLPAHEDALPEPVSPYGAQKYFGEIYGRLFWQSFGLETVSLRYFNVFGPKQDASSPYSGVFARFIPALIAGRRPIVYGDGEQSRDFVYVSDVVRANLDASLAKGVGGKVFNVASGKAVTVNAVFEQARAVIGRKDVEPLREPPRSGDIRHSCADISRARRELDWTPRETLERGLRETVQWYRTNLEEVGNNADT